jgi:hypothetical protein
VISRRVFIIMVGMSVLTALHLVGTVLMNSHRARSINLAAKSQLPTNYSNRDYVLEGGLMSYAADRVAQTHRAAPFYVCPSISSWLVVPRRGALLCDATSGDLGFPVTLQLGQHVSQIVERDRGLRVRSGGEAKSFLGTRQIALGVSAVSKTDEPAQTPGPPRVDARVGLDCGRPLTRPLQTDDRLQHGLFVGGGGQCPGREHDESPAVARGPGTRAGRR